MDSGFPFQICTVDLANGQRTGDEFFKIRFLCQGYEGLGHLPTLDGR
ncbi:hypothetical protein LEP1GSC017_1619 [Leptospira meyeri serovar Hardjo str. Went 5]|nr:hypothetical protein LEP1GSC017_1619 [Leptospira meyeri serovar Hardjo str. Went 5]